MYPALLFDPSTINFNTLPSLRLAIHSQLRRPDDGTEPRVLPPFHLFNAGTADLPSAFGMAASCVIARILIISAPLPDAARRVAGCVGIPSARLKCEFHLNLFICLN